MTYEEAVIWRNDNLTRIGGIDDKGFVVNDLFIVPTSDIDRDKFFRTYLLGTDKDVAIVPYISKDVQVWAVDLDHLKESNILFFDILAR